MSDYIELEYKYKADKVKLTDFIKLVKSLNPIKRLDISSWDHYYTTVDSVSFQRFRQSDSPELTKKIKTVDGNNWNRIEVDLPLDKSRLTEEVVRKYVGLDGYIHDFTIYKTCVIFWLDNVNYVYYITYDEDLKELDRFIEVEVNKNKVAILNSSENNNQGAEWTLNQAASVLRTIGITPQNRMKKSLFDLYVRS